MNYLEFVNRLSKEFFPVVVVEGEDAFLRESAVNTLKKSLNIQIEELNFSVLSGENTSVSDILSLANAYPVMASKRMIIVYDFMFEKIKQEKSSNNLLDYIDNPNGTTCLVFVFNDKNLGHAQMGGATVVDCSKLDYSDVVKWILSEVKLNGKTIEAKSAQKIAEYVDRDMYSVCQAVKKLCAYCADIIDDDSIERLVPKDVEYIVFDLTDAILSKNNYKSLEICKNLMRNVESEKIFAAVYGSFRRMFFSVVSPLSDDDLAKKLSVKPFAIKKAKSQGAKFGALKLKKALEKCYATESALKNFDGNDKNLLFDLVLNLCSL